jgi:hypothetical protein
LETITDTKTVIRDKEKSKSAVIITPNLNPMGYDIFPLPAVSGVLGFFTCNRLPFLIRRPGPYPGLAPENLSPLKILRPDFQIEVWTKNPLTSSRGRIQ